MNFSPWGYVALAVVVAGGAFAYHHHVYDEGVAAEMAIVQKLADAQTAAAEARATTAEHSHDAEIAQLTAYRASHPDQPVRLCLSANPVQPPSAAVSGTEGAGPAAAGVQPVPAGDSGGGPGRAGPDISGLLSALAASADAVSANLREFQERAP